MKHVLVKRLLVLALVITFSTMSSVHAGSKTGVILMHGKWGQSSAKSPVGKLKSALEEAGFLVAAPDMPWSKSRLFDKDFDEAMSEIDKIVAELNSKGASKVVVGGHSIGANAALGYGARREGLAGVLAIAPGHVPEMGRWRDRFKFHIDKAREMIAAGKADETMKFTDNNQGKDRVLTLKARVIASWFSPEVGAVMPINAANIKPNTPLLWIIGKKDRLLKRGQDYVFNKAPPHPKSRYQVVSGGHKATPTIGKAEIIKWLKSL